MSSVSDNLQTIKDENQLNPQKMKKIVNQSIKDKRRKLSELDKKYIKTRMDGRTQQETMRILLPESKSEHYLRNRGGQIERRLAVKKTFNAILSKAGITKQLLAEKIMDGLNADSLQGQGKYSEVRADYNARHKYLTTAIELKGLKPKEEVAHTFDPLTTKLLEMSVDQLRGLVGTSFIEGEVVNDIPDLKVLTIKDKKNG